MEILYLMIICSVSLAVVFLIIFIIGARKGHFEDDESPAVRILMDDGITPSNDEDSKKEKKEDNSDL
ncbi:cbb3-type cytochrome oxidase assembly protein CcoS [Chryseobacterium sp. T1]